MSGFTHGRGPTVGGRIEFRIPLGLMRDECGRRLARYRPTGGEVLKLDHERQKAWVLLDGELYPRFVPMNELGPDPRPPKKKPCGW